MQGSLVLFHVCRQPYNRYLEATSGWDRVIVELELEETHYKVHSKNASSKITHNSNLIRTSNIFFDVLRLKLFVFGITIKHVYILSKNSHHRKPTASISMNTDSGWPCSHR